MRTTDKPNRNQDATLREQAIQALDRRTKSASTAIRGRQRTSDVLRNFCSVFGDVEIAGGVIPSESNVTYRAVYEREG